MFSQVVLRLTICFYLFLFVLFVLFVGVDVGLYVSRFISICFNVLFYLYSVLELIQVFLLIKM